jgi:hypothetical protein
VGTYDTPSFAYDVAVSGDHAYVACNLAGLQVIDIGDPTTPLLAGSYDTPYRGDAIALSGDYAYVADGDSGLIVIDISDPTNPSRAGSYNTPGSAKGVTIAGDYAYVGDYGSGLQVFDISDPTNPSLAGFYDTAGFAWSVTVDGDRAYVADLTNGIYRIDISDPTNPSYAGSYDTPGSAYSIAIAGDRAYVADESSGLQVLQISQRVVDPLTGWSRSLQVNSSNDEILAVRLTTTQTDSIGWYVSADGGLNWQEVFSGDFWNSLSNPGDILLWAASHVFSHPFVNPACSELVIEWLGVSPVVDTITDIPNDQGRQVSISWTRSGYDYVGSSTPITEYAIYRRIDDALSTTPESKARGTDGAVVPAKAGEPHSLLAYPPGDWHFLTTVPARTDDTYATVVPTLVDSTISEGMYHTTFFVRAGTATPGVYFDAEPDSGYSVDNLAPTTPQAFSAAYNSGGGTDLVWEECPDADFQYFCIYRGESDDFAPDPGNLVHTTTGSSWRDDVSEGYKYHYKATSVDFSGNESDPTGPESLTGVAGDVISDRFALHQNVPNPFNPTTVIQYVVPESGAYVTLRIYDVGGRLVRTLVDGVVRSGLKSVVWDGRDGRGVRAASGVYFYRLEAPGYVKTRKMVLMK